MVFFKLVLVGRLENIVSDRRLIEQCARRLGILYFLGYEVGEDLPWHSAISRTRSSMLLPSLSTCSTEYLLSAWLPGSWRAIRKS